MAEESEVTSETDHFVGDCSDFVIKKNKKRKRQPVSDFDTGCLMEKEKNMNLEEKIKKSDMDLEKAKRRLEKIQQENQRLKELKAKKEKEEREKRQMNLGAFMEQYLGTIDFHDPKFLEFLDFVKEDFVKNDSAETMDPEEEHQNSETMEPAEPAPEQQNSDSSGYGF